MTDARLAVGNPYRQAVCGPRTPKTYPSSPENTTPTARLRAIEQAAREHLRARAGGVPWPDVHKARERLRVLLDEPEPPPPMVKPWRK
jgi:hypothetical protein